MIHDSTDSEIAEGLECLLAWIKKWNRRLDLYDALSQSLFEKLDSTFGPCWQKSWLG